MTALLIEPARDWMTRQAEELNRRKGEKPRRQVVRDLVWNEAVLAEITLSIWERVRKTLEEEGFEGRELAKYCQLLLEGIDGRLSGYEQLRVCVEESDLTADAAGLSDLQAKLPALQEVRPKVAEILDLATRPPRSINEEMLNESKAALARGEFVLLNDDCLARLRAGQDF